MSRRPLPPIGAVIFDMDGLLIDSEPVWATAIDAFCARRGASFSAADASACMGRGIPFVADYLARTYGWAHEAEAHVNEICDEFEARAPGAAACLGAEELLRGLRGRLPVALASSTVRRLVEAALGARGWLPMFDAVVTGSDVTRLKPAPDIYLEAARRLGQPAERCLAFEDSPVGCQAAEAAGMFVVAIPGLHGGRPRADLLAASLTAAAEELGLLG